MRRKNIKKVLVFIGAVDQGNIPTGGETAKNYNLLSYFQELYDKVVVCDTMRWKTNPLIILKIIYALIFYRKSTIFISASAHSVNVLVRFISNRRLNNNVFYSTIGGVFHELVQNSKVNIDKLKNIRTIMVESDKMRDVLYECGLANSIKVPNTKYIRYYPKKIQRDDGIVRFVFLSRITSLKGCDLIFDSISKLSAEGYDNRFDVTFYGEIMDDYRIDFIRKINEMPQCRYEGVINLTNPKQYDVLATYDVMLFPTFWPGEGFPGVLVDAFISSLPIIASRWHHNPEIVTDSVNGFLIPAKSELALFEKMKYLIENNLELNRLSIESRKEAEKYDIRKVYSMDFMHRIGMI